MKRITMSVHGWGVDLNPMTKCRAGMTIIELLVVMVVIGLLMTLLLPALHIVRESARRTECQSNMRQIGLAFQQHVAALGTLPPSRTVQPVHSGWTIHLLSYLEQVNVTDRYNFDLDFCDPVNEPAIQTRLSVFECPTNPSPGQQIAVAKLGQNPTDITGAAGDYFVNHLLHNMGMPNGMARLPALVIGVYQNPANITDGLSHTTLVHEQTGRPRYYIGRKQITNQVVPNAAWGAWGSYQHFQYQGYAADGMSPGWDCAINCSNGVGIYSFHPSGANTLFCDGRVQFLSQSIDINVVFALATRDGGEVVDDTSTP